MSDWFSYDFDAIFLPQVAAVWDGQVYLLTGASLAIEKSNAAELVEALKKREGRSEVPDPAIVAYAKRFAGTGEKLK